MARIANLVPLFALPAMLGACTLGPDYRGPPATPPIGGTFVRAGDLGGDQPSLARWWTAFGDSTLNALMDEALRSNPDLAQVEARLRQARASLRLERANQAPTASAMASRRSVTRRRTTRRTTRR